MGTTWSYLDITPSVVRRSGRICRRTSGGTAPRDPKCVEVSDAGEAAFRKRGASMMTAFSTLGDVYGESSRTPITVVTLFGGFASTVCWPLSTDEADAEIKLDESAKV